MVWPIYPSEANVSNTNLVRRLKGFSWVDEVKVTFTLEQVTKAQRGNRGIAPPFL